MDAFSWLKVVHLLGIILWMGTLLTLTRILAFHAAEAPALQGGFLTLERRIWAASFVGMLLVVLSGTVMLALADFAHLNAKVAGAGFHIKLTLVVALIAVQIVLQQWMHRLHAAHGSVSAGRFKLLDRLAGALLLGVVVAVYVLYPMMMAAAHSQ
jgi:uncharacterized membrane protein